MAANPAVISVIGSLNVDLVTRVARVPDGGESLTSESFDIGWGGKGANQAVACARLSRTAGHAGSSETSDIQVRMVGAVGNDQFHADLVKALEADGVNTSGVEIVRGRRTGVALVVVETGTGENRIMYCPGANHDVKVADLVHDDAKVALFQLELPLEVVLHNIRAARQKGIETVLNPSPAVPLPEEVYRGLDHLIVNETEASILSGMDSPASWDEVAATFISRGVKHVIITLGAKGVFYKNATQQSQSQAGRITPACKVEVVDTTAAGDTFAGAYAVVVARSTLPSQDANFSMDAAVDFANRAASMTVQKAGAQTSIPWSDQVPPP